MKVEAIKHTLAMLTPDEQREVSAFLFHLRHSSDPDFRDKVESRLSDPRPENWLTPEEFERQLDAK